MFTHLIKLIVLFCLTQSVWSEDKIQEDTGDIPEIIESRGFQCESHFIITEDGYILGTYRIINPLARKHFAKPLKPVIMQSGLLGSAADFLINAPDGFIDEEIMYQAKDLESINFGTKGRNMGFILANLGYDVWLSNPRGNYYSRNHTNLDPNDRKNKTFWRISLDDVALKDLPATIDYVRKTTKQQIVGYIGYSRGSSVMFALLSERPEFAKIVKPFIAIAPAVQLDHARSRFGFLMNFKPIVNFVKNNPNECLPRKDRSYVDFCSNLIARPFCNFIEDRLLSMDRRNANASRMNIYLTHDPAGSPCWDFLHFGQTMQFSQFRKLDLGKGNNVKLYGVETPPRYPLENIESTDIAVISSVGDKLANQENIGAIKKLLKTPVKYETTIMLNHFGHLDFLFSAGTGNLVNTHVAQILHHYRKL